MKLSEQTPIGLVSLTVNDGDKVAAYYREIIGLQEVERQNEVIHLGVEDRPLVALHVDPAAIVPKKPQVGLYHLALLLPSRRNLALVLRHLIEEKEPLGASDHGVSEALYLNDPEGNGIEIYADRPRDRWPVDPRTGQLAIVTEPLNGADLLQEIEPGDRWERLPDGTRMGHVHLRVAHIPQTKSFYIDGLGFDFMQDYGPSASFVSVAGYHHHLGFNSWETKNMAPASPDLAGLRFIELRLSDQTELDRAVARLTQSGQKVAPDPAGFFVVDPNGIQILLTCASS